jgi:sucrose-6-phosphate hydrolase SacC (GH32 family)
VGIVYSSPEKMWDTWIYQAGDEFHLFFLSGGDIGRAVSTDLIHWNHLPAIKNTAAVGDWDEAGMKMTGSIAKVGESYYLCYGSGVETPIGLIRSEDLVTWTRVGDSPILPSKAPYDAGNAWRDLTAYLDEATGVWNGYLYAIHGETGKPAIAHIQSKDYLTWSYHEPIYVSDETYNRTNNGFMDLEVPDYFEMGGSRYMLFSSCQSRKHSTSGRADAMGTWYIRAGVGNESWELPPAPLLLGSGQGRFDNYVGRTVMYRGQRLLYHQTWGEGKVSWATPKLVNQDADGSLVLRYWPDLDRLITGAATVNRNFSVHAASDETACELIDTTVADFMLTCTADVSHANSATLLWHVRPGSTVVASGLHIDSGKNTISMVEVRYLEQSVRRFNGNTYSRYLRDNYAFGTLDCGNLQIRIISRAHQAEVYINDVWVFSMDMSDLPSSGQFGILCDSGQTHLSEVVISELEPLAREDWRND